MKKMLSKVWRQIIAFMLALVMTICSGESAIVALAETKETEKEVINYVSLGDSMTNGYGLKGYEATKEDGSTVGVNGYLQKADAAYPTQFVNYLQKQNPDKVVNYTQLAMSAMRAEDLHFTLEFDYTNNELVQFVEDARNWQSKDWSSTNEARWNEKFSTGDYYTWDNFVDSNRFNKDVYDEAWFKTQYGGNGSGTAAVASTYQEAVASADIVSIGIGNGNIGVFLLDLIMDAVGFGDDENEWVKLDAALRGCDESMQEQIMQVYNQMKAAMLKDFVTDSTDENSNSEQAILDSELVEKLADAMTYVLVSYMLNYAGIVERIVELNPDVEIMIVGLMNTLNGMNFSYAGKTFDLGDYMYEGLSMINAYLAGLPAVMQATGKYPDATFYYADAPNVDVMVNNYSTAIKDTTVTTTRERFITEIVGESNKAGEFKKGLIWQLVSEMYSVGEISLSDVQEYENMSDATKVTYASKNATKATSIALYLAFEDAIVKSSIPNNNATMSLEGILALGNVSSGNSDLLNGVMEEVSTNLGKNSSKYFDTVVSVVASANDTTSDDVTFMYNADDDFKKTIDNLCTLLAIPDTMSTALQNDQTVFGLCNMFARCLIGDGLGAHPSEEGHNTLYEAVKTAYENNHTAQQETLDNLQKALEAVGAIVAEYYDDAYAYAYAEAKKAGYIDDVLAQLDAIKAELNAVDTSSLNISDDLKAELDNDIENAIETIDALQKLVEEADLLDNATLQAVIELLNKLGQNVTDLRETITVVGKDAGSAAAEELAKLGNELWEEYETLKSVAQEDLKKALDMGTEYLKEKLGETYDALVDAAKKTASAAESYGAKAAEYIYSWLVNSPEKVFALLNEYGDDVVDFLVDHKDVIFSVIGYIASEYGDDIADYVLAHADDIFTLLVDICEKYADQAWDLIKAYLDQLDIFGNNIDADLLNDILEGLGNLLSTYGPELMESGYEMAEELINEYINQFVNQTRPQIEKTIEQLNNQLKALEEELAAKKAELEKAAGEFDAKLQAEIKAAIDEINAQIAEIKAAIETLNAQLEKIDAKIAELEKAAKELNDAVKAFVSATDENIKDAAEKLEEAIADIKDVAEKVEKALNTADETIAKIKKTMANVADTVDEVVAAVEKAIADLDDEAKANIEAVLNEITTITDKVNSAIADFQAIVKANKDRMESIVTSAKEIQSEIEKFLVDGKADLDAVKKAVKEAANTIASMVEDAADAIEKIDKTIATVTDSVKAFNADAKDLVEKTVASINKVVETIETRIAEVEAAIDTLNDQLEKIDAQIKALKTAAKELKEAVKELIAKVEAGVDGSTSDFKAQIKEASKKVSDAVEKTIEVVGTADTIIKETVKTVENIVKVANNIAKDVKEITAMMKAVAEDADKLVADLDAAVKELETKAEEAVKTFNSNLKKTVESLKDSLESLYGKATTGEYTVTEDSYYVALGDATAAGTTTVTNSYADLLAADKELGLSEDQYESLANENYRIEDFLYILSEDAEADAYTKANVKKVEDLRATYTAAIKKADLITISAVSDAYVAAQLSKVMDDGVAYEMDWARYLGTKGAAAVEKVFDKMEQALAISVDESLVKMLVTAVEAYAYSYIGYTYTYPELLNAIHELNPEAKVIAVGAYNPLEALEINGISIGKYLGVLTEISNAQLTGYAMLTPNTTFVAIPDTETVMASDAEDMDIITYVMALIGGEMTPSEAGHKYIEAQILKALTITDGRHYHVYDDAYSYDESGHWRACECGDKTEVEAHVYTDDKDTTCNVCGYERKVDDQNKDDQNKDDQNKDDQNKDDQNKDDQNKDDQNKDDQDTTVTYVAPFTATLKKTSYTYNGKAKKPAVTVKDKNGTVVDAKYYTVKYSNNKKAGKATVTISFKAPYSSASKITKKFTIKKTTYKKISIKNVVYTGKKITKLTLVTSAGVKLAKSDYKILTKTFKKNKNVGTASVKIRFLGKNVKKKTVTMKFKIVPKSTSIKSVKAAKKKLTVKWKKRTAQVTGYQIQYSTSKSFTKKTTKTVKVSSSKKTTKTIKKLKAKKKYYVRIRTYKKVGKKTYYSKWSKVKTKKTK